MIFTSFFPVLRTQVLFNWRLVVNEIIFYGFNCINHSSVVCVGQSLGMTETLKLRFSKDEAHHIINPEIVNKPSDILPVIEENGTNLQSY